MTEKTAKFFRRYNPRMQWLHEQWGDGTQPATWGIDPITNHQLPITNKILRDGQLLIIRGDKTYTITGTEVR
jgi:hypothetical protein